MSEEPHQCQNMPNLQRQNSLLIGSSFGFDYLGDIVHSLGNCALIGIGLDGVIRLWNDDARQFYGYTTEEILDKGSIDSLFVSKELADYRLREITDMVFDYGAWEGRELLKRKDGGTFIAHMIARRLPFIADEVRGWVLFARNITDALSVSDELHSQIEAGARAKLSLSDCESRYRLVVGMSRDAIIHYDGNGIVRDINPGAEALFGYANDEIKARPISFLVPEYIRCTSLSSTDQPQRLTLRGVHKDGYSFPISICIAHDNQGEHIVLAGALEKQTERRQSTEKVSHIAQLDPLTNLPNRTLFYDRIHQSIAHARRNHESVAVLFLDLDGFKQINDSLGHQVGDSLLRMVAKRMLLCVRAEDSVGRIGGDEFVIGLPLRGDDSRAITVADKVLEALREPFQVKENSLHISGSIGIGLYPKDGENAETLVGAADSAMYHAKQQGRNNCQFFTASLNEAAHRRLSIANGLHTAIANDELTLEYQPQIDLVDGKIFGAEALVRWQHTELGNIPPLEFIKIAEETGLITMVGEWVLSQACHQLVEWRHEGFPNLRMAVNLSPRQFRQHGFVDMVRQILRDASLPAVALDLEISENVLMLQTTENIELLTELAGLGVQLAVDDFGTGYTNFTYLKRYPIDTIKVDQSFLHGEAEGQDDSAVIAAILAMADNLHLRVVAEGVETIEQVEFLRSHGCLAAQGNLFKPPVSGKHFRELLANIDRRRSQ